MKYSVNIRIKNLLILITLFFTSVVLGQYQDDFEDETLGSTPEILSPPFSLLKIL